MTQIDGEDFFMCTCAGHGISLFRFLDEPEIDEIEISIWKRGANGVSFSWRDRLSFIWQIITKGHAGADGVLLSRKDATELRDKLTEWVEATVE